MLGFFIPHSEYGTRKRVVTSSASPAGMASTTIVISWSLPWIRNTPWMFALERDPST